MIRPEEILENADSTRPELAMLKLTKISRFRTALLGALLFSGACNYKVPASEATASGKEVFQLCSECHGTRGEGHQEYNAPAIAGLPQWYIEAQLKKFKTGARGTHPADMAGMMMRPMTKSFHNEGDLKVVAAYVSTMQRPSPAPVLSGGDAAKGKTLYAVCSACHQPDGSGQPLVKAPPLKQASDWYLLVQLKKFKDGVRGGTPRDLEGSQMRPQAAALPSEQAMKDVVAYIATLK